MKFTSTQMEPSSSINPKLQGKILQTNNSINLNPIKPKQPINEKPKLQTTLSTKARAQTIKLGLYKKSQLTIYSKLVLSLEINYLKRRQRTTKN